MMFSIFPSPESTTGTLFILYVDSSKSMVRKELDVCKARNGAQRNDPEISLTFVFLYSAEEVRVSKKFPEAEAAEKELKLLYLGEYIPFVAAATAGLVDSSDPLATTSEPEDPSFSSDCKFKKCKQLFN